MRTYHLDQFAEFQGPTVASIVAIGEIDLAGIAALSIGELPAAVPAAIRALIEAGDDPERPIGNAGARFPSRSEAVFSVACGLARADCNETQITGILLNEAYLISASILEKKSPKKYALKQARAAITAVGNSWPDVMRSGQPRSTLRNTIVALQRLGIEASYNLFRRRKQVSGHQLEAFRGEMTDDISAALRRIILDEFGFDPTKEHVRDAIHMLSLENSFHPIRDYLSGVKWDGESRLDTMLSVYFGAEDNALNRAFGSIMMIARYAASASLAPSSISSSSWKERRGRVSRPRSPFWQGQRTILIRIS
jgi:hypothetical protein